MLIRIWLFGISIWIVSSELSGQNVCEVEERYPVNITQFSLRNVTVRNYKWCMGFPPRCSFYTVKTVKVPEIVERLHTRYVRKCCPGFVENVNHDGCVQCKKCFEGTCGNGGACLCNSGFQGEECADACPPMRWGINCQQECLCEHGTCNPRTGRCDCPTGWFGTRCEVSCLEGFFGKHCINRCKCGERDLCNPETGKCLKKRLRQQEHHSTRAIHYMTADIVNFTISMNKQHKSTPSLKKYYSFDMELTTNNETVDENEIMGIKSTSKEHKKTNTTKKVTIPLDRERSTKSTTVVLSTKTEPSNKTLQFTDDSAESTTEMIAEMIHKNQNVVMIDENGSLENHNRENSRENPLDNSHVNSDSQENEHQLTGKNTFEFERRNEVEHRIIQESQKHHSKNQTIDKRKHERNGIKLEDPVVDGTTIRYNPKITNSSKPSVGPKVSSSNYPESIDRESSSKKTTEKTGVTSHILEDIVPPTVIRPKPATISSSKDFKVHNNADAIEENELQILDSMNNILTSRETTTTSSPLSTSTGPMDVLKKGILPVDVALSTKSLDISNDLQTSESTENQISVKEAYGKNGASEEFEYSANNKDITTHISVVAGVSFFLVLILSGMVLVHYYFRRKKTKSKSMKIDNQNFSGHTVSVYTHSIFHTPLPDPPPFENPVFKAPSDVSNDQRTFQTHVICSLNFPENKIKDEKEYTYDHPPSTGSYRAASIPEPPEIFETPGSEPVYDEIPSNKRSHQPMSPPPSYKSSCLYMNTCGQTKF